MRKIGLLATACILLAGPALAQSLGERTGVNSALGITPKTSDFVKEAAISDMFEIESSKLAEQKTQGDVKSFADLMVTDHTKTSAELKSQVQGMHVKVPTALDPAHQKMLDKLRGLNGADFTKQYIDDQVSGHKDAVSLFQRYAKGGRNDKLRSWAATTLPTLQHHLDLAQGLSSKVVGSR
jgi:putative membrane protein